MASVGDLFVNVRAKTQGLNKGLKKANRSISSFASTAAKSLGALAGGFAIFKGLQKLGSMMFSSLMYQSHEFRAAWANLNNELVNTFGALAQRWGPALAKILDSIAQTIYEITLAMKLIPWGLINKDIKKKILAPGRAVGVAITKANAWDQAKAVGNSAQNMYTDPGTFLDALAAFADQMQNTRQQQSQPVPVVIVSGGPA